MHTWNRMDRPGASLCYLENDRSFLDAPGEYFLDRSEGYLYYIPRENERLEKAVATVPVPSQLLEMKGTAEKWIEDVRIENLTLEYSRYSIPWQGNEPNQGACLTDASVSAEYARNLTLQNVEVTHTGNWAVEMGPASRDSRVEHCYLHDLGGGGVKIGTSGIPDDEEHELSCGNHVVNNIICQAGETFPPAVGIMLRNASDNEVVHNDISNLYYTGISVGWVWGYAHCPSVRNTISYNHIHHIGWGVLSDMGGVYTLGNSDGTVEIGNWIHDVNGYSGAGSPAWGLYTDEGSAGILLASNLVERCRDGAVHQHYGKDNTFANNIFATFERSGVWRSRVEDHTTIIVTNNVFWWTNSASQVIRGGGKGGKVTDLVMDGNLYWCTGGISSNAFFGKPLATWRAEGHDCASRVGDPLFRDPLHGDWRLEPESSALKMGFVPWDWTAAGVLKDDPAWRAEAMDDTRYPPLKDAPPAPRFFRVRGSIDFEAFKPGTTGRKNLSFLQVYGEKGVTVTDETAASGKNSLRLEDSPKPAANWEPHLIANIGAKHGSVRIRWSFRTDDKARPQFECRDYKQDGARPYAIGPSITFASGHVRTGGRKIADVPVGEWSRVEILLHVTGPKAGTWSCTVTPSGGEPVTVDGLKVQTGFRILEWNGFMTNGKEGTWYLDDFSVEPVECR